MKRDTDAKREREKALVSEMIALYCRKKHGARGALCPDCAALNEYARLRSEKCPFMETKTSAPTAGCTATGRTCARRYARSCASRGRGCCCTTPYPP